jgi:ferrochelatase
VAAAAGLALSAWQLVYQSRSGRPEDPWLGPDVCDHLRTLPSRGTTDVILMPIGFLSDHMEVQYDLDYEARQVCDELGLRMVRAATVGTHPLFVRMLRELIEERLSGSALRTAVGSMSAWPDFCPLDCCPAGARSRV